MDTRTIILLLAVGSYILGLLLLIFKYNKHTPQQVPYWINAKLLQGTGSLLLYFKPDTFDWLTLLANILLLLGCAYEVLAIRVINDQIVRKKRYRFIAAFIIIFSLLTAFMGSPQQSGMIFFIQSVLYFLPGIFLFRKSGMKLTLHNILGACYHLTGLVFLVAAVICLGFPSVVPDVQKSLLGALIPGVSFFIFLVSGFIILMLAKERSDLQVQEIQKTLQKTEIRFKRIVETSIEGILVFNENYQITFANNNMASMLGYSVDEMIGKTYASFFPESQIDIYRHEEAKRKSGDTSIYECMLKRKDGQLHWFLISARAIMNDEGKFEGSFAMLTDINERKEMELLLEKTNRQLIELSNTDGLIGIPNRRFFDTNLEHEYSRLSRSKSELSIIIFDIDKFKEYNDYYGHVMGDEVLKKIGSVLTSCITRSVDIAARYGGEEFAVILPETDSKKAVMIAEMIRNKILDLKIEHIKSPISQYITASFGVATVRYNTVKSPQEIVILADKQLYKAKISGRNNVQFDDVV